MNAETHKGVIALTAHALKEERERAYREGFSGYLTKPISKVILLQKLQSSLTTSRAIGNLGPIYYQSYLLAHRGIQGRI